MTKTRWLKQWGPTLAMGLMASVLAPPLDAQAGVTWPSNQVLPSFSAPAGTVEILDLLATSDFRYEAEGSQVRHGTGRLDGNGWLAQTGIDAPNQFLITGPYAADIPVGANTAFFELTIDNNTANDELMVTLDVRDNTTGALLAVRDVTRKAFSQASSVVTFELPYTNPAAGHGLEFRVFWHGRSYIKVDAVGTRAAVDNEVALFTTLSLNGWGTANSCWRL